MIARYTRPEMGAIFSDHNRFSQWLEVELAASEALAELGEIPQDAARALRAHAAFDVARIHEIEAPPPLPAGCITASLPTTSSIPRRRWC